jgi:serine/threonine protein kinase
MLGYGSYGEVYEGTSPLGRVAVKRLRQCDSVFRGELLAEGLRHSCVVALLGAHVSRACADLVMAHGGDRTAQDCLRADDFLATHALCLARDVLSGISYIHQQGLVHLDLKPDNILWCRRRARARIADFGCMCRVGYPVATLGAVEWRAPEVRERSPRDEVIVATFGLDLWGLGVVLSRTYAPPRSGDALAAVRGAVGDISVALAALVPEQRVSAREASHQLQRRMCWWRCAPLFPVDDDPPPLSRACSLGRTLEITARRFPPTLAW